MASTLLTLNPVRATLVAAVASGVAWKFWRTRHREWPTPARTRAPALAPEAPPLAETPIGPVPRWRQFIDFMREAIEAWVDDYAQSMGAALSYYSVFSIAPLLVIVISVAGIVFGEEAARNQIFQQLSGFLGADGAAAIQGLLKSASLHNKGVIGTTIGVVLLFAGATSVLSELQNALDRVRRAPERNRPKGLRGLIRARLMSFGMILGLGFLLVISLVASAALAALGDWWAPLFGGWEFALHGVDFIVAFALVTLLFALIYKLLPSVRIAWRDVWFGAGITALLFTIGKLLIGLYIGKSAVTSGFGAASSVVVLLIWVYYSAQIFLIGAEFTWVFAHRFGSKKDEKRELNAPAPEPRRSAQPA